MTGEGEQGRPYGAFSFCLYPYTPGRKRAEISGSTGLPDRYFPATIPNDREANTVGFSPEDLISEVLKKVLPGRKSGLP